MCTQYIDDLYQTKSCIYRLLLPTHCLQDWDQPEYIPDPDAEKPEDWDDDMDGEWEPPMIPNPEYKGQ